MFSVKQKQEISEAIQKILRETNHPELPPDEIKFDLHVWGKETWSWVDIKNGIRQGLFQDRGPRNEKQDKR